MTLAADILGVITSVAWLTALVVFERDRRARRNDAEYRAWLERSGRR